MKTLCSKISNLIKGYIARNERNRTSVLNDGTSIVRPFSYALIIFLMVSIVFVFFWNMIVTDFFNRFGFVFFINGLPNFFTIIQKMIVQVNWSYFDKVVQPLIETIKISIIGTLGGAIIAIPFAIIASQNIMGKSRIPNAVKFFLSIVRTFPTLVYALIFSFIFDYGTFIGVLATIIFTFSIITKMMYEIIEAIDMGAFIAIEATGATKLQAFRAAVVPQILGRFYSVVLYNFEINLRASAILGFVNAGGIGIIMNDQMALMKYGNVAVIVLALLAVVIVVQNLSQYLRRRLS
ncbi:MAG: phosphonate ABC transporter, permease protein PhnE [Acholeplasmataceae bacterium]|nr:phosphonate ABC transporter, permease protein PhnE [Acholeplasmataceae bacterium]